MRITVTVVWRPHADSVEIVRRQLDDGIGNGMATAWRTVWRRHEKRRCSSFGGMPACGGVAACGEMEGRRRSDRHGIGIGIAVAVRRRDRAAGACVLPAVLPTPSVLRMGSGGSSVVTVSVIRHGLAACGDGVGGDDGDGGVGVGRGMTLTVLRGMSACGMTASMAYRHVHVVTGGHGRVLAAFHVRRCECCVSRGR